MVSSCLHSGYNHRDLGQSKSTNVCLGQFQATAEYFHPLGSKLLPRAHTAAKNLLFALLLIKGLSEPETRLKVLPL